MADHPSLIVQNISEQVADHMDAILKFFKPGAKIAVLVRRPEASDGSQDFILTNDTIDDVIAALQQRKTQPTLTGDV
ncbi:hypothetical protein NKJ09_23345 [Mesorhizobium sp. M0189]|uniref:hypothetical protein n=1 Tax=Mesorhizobium sp. M0189 TaxID=2956909 RepID=UPI00333D4A5F